MGERRRAIASEQRAATAAAAADAAAVILPRRLGTAAADRLLAGALGLASGLLGVLLLVSATVSPEAWTIAVDGGGRVADGEDQFQAGAPPVAGAQPVLPRAEPSVGSLGVDGEGADGAGGDGSVGGDGTSGGAAPGGAAVGAASARKAVAGLLRLRDRAVVDADPAAWASTVAPGADGGFGVLSTLPLSSFTSTMVADSLEPAPAEVGGWQARVLTTFQLGGAPAMQRVDTVSLAAPDPAADPAADPAVDPAGGSAAPGLAGPGGTWRVRSWTPFPELGQIGTSAPWDLGPVTAVQGSRSVVLVWGEDEGWGDRVTGWTDQGAVVVDSYVGTDWPRVSLVLVPATTEQFDALVPGPPPQADDVFAAVTTDIDTPVGVGDLVVVNPTARGDLVEETWQVTITHELVHVASGSLYGDGQEIWLAEGLADLVGWSELVPAVADRESVAARLLDRVDDGTAPLAALPSDDAFASADAGVVGDAYEGSWLAVLLLQDQLGTDGLLQLYAQASAGDGSSQERTERAIQQATGSSREQFEAGWQAYVRELAAG